MRWSSAWRPGSRRGTAPGRNGGALTAAQASAGASAARGAGLALLLCGEALRKAAMVTAGRGFTHAVAVKKRADHELVTRGVYRWARHPGYLGWLLWAVGTQLLLANPASVVLFAALVRVRVVQAKRRAEPTDAAAQSWRFFSERIAFEEAALRRFFGQQYVEYARRTPTRIPGIP